MATETQIVREAPEIEKQRLGLLTSAKELADRRLAEQLPIFAVAPEDALTTAAIGRALEAGSTGIGGFRRLVPGMQTALQAAPALATQQLPSALQFLSATGQGIGTLGTTAGQQISGLGGQVEQDRQGLLQLTGGVIGGAQLGQDAAQLARQGTLDVAQQVPGQVSASQDVLRGGIGQFDPRGTGQFMNPFEDAAVQQALADIRRAGDVQAAQIGGRAAQAGAFGGSRQAILESELDRNILEQQGRTAAQMRQAGFESAAQRAQQAFEAARGRQLQAGSALGQLGLQGAQQQAALQQQAGQLGLQGSQLGLQGAQQQAALQQQAGQLGLQGSQLGLQGTQQQGALQQQAGQLGLQGAQFGLQGLQQQAALRQAALDATNRQAALLGQGAQLGIGALGQQAALAAQKQQLGAQAADVLGQAGLRLGTGAEALQQTGLRDIEALRQLGAERRALAQANLEAGRQSSLQTLYEPYQRIGFLSDIYKGAPSSQMSIASRASPQTSPGERILGLGIAGLAAAGGAAKTGLFG
jgi:hypothetical protein